MMELGLKLCHVAKRSSSEDCTVIIEAIDKITMQVAEIETLRAALLAERERIALAVEGMGTSHDSHAGERFAAKIRALGAPHD